MLQTTLKLPPDFHLWKVAAYSYDAATSLFRASLAKMLQVAASLWGMLCDSAADAAAAFRQLDPWPQLHERSAGIETASRAQPWCKAPQSAMNQGIHLFSDVTQACVGEGRESCRDARISICGCACDYSWDLLHLDV